MAHIITRPEAERVRASVGHRMLSSFFKGGLYGSFRDGTWLVSKKEIDGDLFIYVGFMSEEDHNKYINYIEESPGYVNVDVTDVCQVKFEQMFPESSMKLIERDDKKYISALALKDDLSDIKTIFTNLNDETMNSFTEFMEPIPESEVDPHGASAPLRLQSGHGINIHADLVLCIACCGWPRIADSWITRDRKAWPEKSLIQEITNSVFHLVSKPSLTGDAEIDLRLSFSFAESKLMDTITGPRLATYMVLKNLFNENCKLKDLDVLKTYHFKTVFFWTCEKQTDDYWNMEQIENCVCCVLDSLIEGFDKGFIKHYFIPEINLLKDVQKDLSKTIEELKIIKQELEIISYSPDPDTEAVAMMELASTKEQYDFGNAQLAKREDVISDMRYMGMAWMKECSHYISDCASMACHSVNKKIIDTNQLWDIEETLSCCYAILSAFVEKLNSVEKESTEESLIMLLTTLFTKYMKYKEQYQEDTEIDTRVKEVCESEMNTEKRIHNIEYTHGYHEQPNNLIYLPFAELLLKLVFTVAKMTISRDIESLLNKIVNPVSSDDKWNLDILLKVVKSVLPDFKWSDEGHLSVHQLAQDGVGKLEVLFDTLVQQRSTPNVSFEDCNGKCWEKRVHFIKEVLFGPNSVPSIEMFNVICKKESLMYAEGQKLDNLKMLLLLRKGT